MVLFSIALLKGNPLFDKDLLESLLVPISCLLFGQCLFTVAGLIIEISFAAFVFDSVFAFSNLLVFVVVVWLKCALLRGRLLNFRCIILFP